MTLDTHIVARNFARSSGSYDSEAQLQSAVRAELLSRLPLLFRPKGDAAVTVLDLGAGTGRATAGLSSVYPKASILQLDIALPMLQQAGRQQANTKAIASWWRKVCGAPLRAAVCADAAALPLANGCVDLVYSNLMLQWCDPPDRALAEIRRVLKPRGLLLLSTFGPGSLVELRSAWAAVDNDPHVSSFVDMHDLGAALGRAGFTEPVLDVDRLRSQFATPRDLLKHLQRLGARNAAIDRPRGLTGRKRLAAMLAAYEVFRGDDGLVPASWEVIYLSAFAAEPRAVEHEHRFAVSDLEQSLRSKRPDKSAAT